MTDTRFRWILIPLLLALWAGGSTGKLSAQDRPYSLALSGAFTTSSKLFHHPNDPDELLRSEFLPLDDIFSGGIDVRRSFDDIRLQFGLSAEYLTKSETIDLSTATSQAHI